MRRLLIALALAATGCGARDTAPTVTSALELSPKRVGLASVRLALADVAQRPLTGAAVALEGNMNHAGMRPTFAQLKETAPGRYEGALELTMAGDWIVRVAASRPGAVPVELTIPVPGVAAR